MRILAIKDMQLILNDIQTHIFHKNLHSDTKQIGTGHFWKLGLFIIKLAGAQKRTGTLKQDKEEVGYKRVIISSIIQYNIE